jgi:hypothetical protein
VEQLRQSFEIINFSQLFSASLGKPVTGKRINLTGYLTVNITEMTWNKTILLVVALLVWR